MKSVALIELLADPITRAVLSGVDLGAPNDPSGVAAAYRAHDVRDRAELAASIEATMLASPAGDDVWRASLLALKQPGTLAVVTGQQIGALGGPLYAVYKALAAVSLARQLSKEGLGRVVPIFWMATQDHDIAEIDHAHVLDAHGDLTRLHFRCTSGGAAVGELAVTRDMVSTFERWSAARLGSGNVAVIAQLAPGEGESWTRWFVRCMRTYLPGIELLYFDPRTHARPTAPLLTKALIQCDQVKAVLTAGVARLATNQLNATLPVDDASVVFDHRGGRRERLRVQGDRVIKGGRAAPLGGVLAAIDANPALFSGNVALRPVLQGALIPCVAYVAGPAEIAYYQQLPELFRLFEVPFPAIVARYSATALVPQARELLRRLDVTSTQAICEPGALAHRVDASLGSEANVRDQLGRLLDGYANRSPGMVRAVMRARRTIERALDRLARQSQLMSLKQASEPRAPRMEALLNLVRPKGKLQERVLSAATFVVEYGAAPLISDLARQDPRQARHYVIDL